MLMGEDTSHILFEVPPKEKEDPCTNCRGRGHVRWYHWSSHAGRYLDERAICGVCMGSGKRTIRAIVVAGIPFHQR